MVPVFNRVSKCWDSMVVAGKQTKTAEIDSSLTALKLFTKLVCCCKKGTIREETIVSLSQTCFPWCLNRRRVQGLESG